MKKKKRLRFGIKSLLISARKGVQMSGPCFEGGKGRKISKVGGDKKRRRKGALLHDTENWKKVKQVYP